VGLPQHIVQKVIYTNGRRFACERQMVSLIEEPSTLQGWTFKYKGKKKEKKRTCGTLWFDKALETTPFQYGSTRAASTTHVCHIIN